MMTSKRTFLLAICLLGATFHNAFASLLDEIDEVQTYASIHPQLSLAIGVAIQEENLNQRFNENWVFLDDNHQGNLIGRRLTLSFNDLDALKSLSEKLPNSFIRIAVDYNTYKFSQWTTSHLGYFRTLLKNGGTFEFQPEYAYPAFIADAFENKETLSVHMTQNLKGDFLEHQPSIPQDFPVKEGAYSEKILERVKKEKEQILAVVPFASESVEKFLQECANVGMTHSTPPQHLLQSPEKLERYIARLKSRISMEINKNHFLEDFFQEAILPHNQMVLEKIFSQVELKRDAAYPIPIHSVNQKFDIFVCTK